MRICTAFLVAGKYGLYAAQPGEDGLDIIAVQQLTQLYKHPYISTEKYSTGYINADNMDPRRITVWLVWLYWLVVHGIWGHLI